MIGPYRTPLLAVSSRLLDFQAWVEHPETNSHPASESHFTIPEGSSFYSLASYIVFRLFDRCYVCFIEKYTISDEFGLMRGGGSGGNRTPL